MLVNQEDDYYIALGDFNGVEEVDEDMGYGNGGALSKWLSRLGDFRRNRNFGGDGKEKIPCDWDWAECSVTCGGGVQKSVVTWKSDEDTECNPPESKQCNSRPCE